MDWTEFGDANDPTVVLLHGTPGCAAFFEPLSLPLAAAGFHVLAPDFPGYRESAALAEPWSNADLVSALASDLKDRGITDLSLVGFSSGSYRALALALSGEFRVASVFLLAGFAFLDEPNREGFRGFVSLLRSGADPGSPEFRTIMKERMLAPEFAKAHPDIAEGVADWLTLAPLEVQAADIAALAALVDLRPALAKLDVRVTVRVGELDIANPPEFAQAIVDAVPQGTLQMVPGCGHSLLLEDAEATVAAVIESLR
jgi:3-oxoadipate enol-lactonase